MNELKVTFLGTDTSMGVPVIGCSCKVCKSDDQRDKRLRASILIRSKGQHYIIDSGPDFRYQVLRAGINELRALIFTHEHKDHTAGMDDVRAFNFIQSKPVDIYASTRVEAALRHDYHYAFTELRYPGVPEIRFHTIDENKAFTIDGSTFIPILVWHHKLPVLAFRINDFTYITDANHIPEEEWPKLIGTKVLVINALRQHSHISHFTLEEALEIIRKINPERAYLTHISHQMGLHAEVSALLPDNVFIAEDQQEIYC